MVRNRMRWRLGICGVLVLSLACVEQTPALFIVHNSALNENCQPTQSAAGESVRRGTMDVTVADTYRMFPLVENVMSPSGSASLGGGSAGGDYEGNRVTFQSAKVSFHVRDTNQQLRQCLIATREIGISGTLEPGGSRTVELEIINQNQGACLKSIALLQQRGYSFEVEAEIQFFGMTTSGTDVESNLFIYPLEICRGCLIEFPLDANDPDDVQPNCRREYDATGDDLEDIDMGCFPGQDDGVDCRICKILVAAAGGREDEVEQSCEPRIY
ncbi:MAG: hypothetical protein JW797_00570 [Bradymonadales bacterium]|nr:hypothetical protein [Bradymonadales bacterium]